MIQTFFDHATTLLTKLQFDRHKDIISSNGQTKYWGRIIWPSNSFYTSGTFHHPWELLLLRMNKFSVNYEINLYQNCFLTHSLRSERERGPGIEALSVLKCDCSLFQYLWSYRKISFDVQDISSLSPSHFVKPCKMVCPNVCIQQYNILSQCAKLGVN